MELQESLELMERAVFLVLMVHRAFLVQMVHRVFLALTEHRVFQELMELQELVVVQEQAVKMAFLQVYFIMKQMQIIQVDTLEMDIYYGIIQLKLLLLQ